MERPKFNPSPHQNPLTDLHKNWKAWLRPGRHPACKKVCNDRFRGFCSPDTWFCRAFGVTSMFVFLGSSIRLQPTPLHGLLRKIRQMTSFRVKKCFWGSRWLYFIFRPLNFRQNRHFGDRFWLDGFLRPKIALTWGCSNIKLPNKSCIVNR